MSIVLATTLIPADADAHTYGDAFTATRLRLLEHVGRDHNHAASPWWVDGDLARKLGVADAWRCDAYDVFGQKWIVEVLQAKPAMFGDDDRCRLCGSHLSCPCEPGCPNDPDCTDAEVVEAFLNA